MMKIVVFDLHGTLVESNEPLDEEISLLLTRLLAKTKVAVISGASWQRFETQIIKPLENSEDLNNLFLLPASGGSLFQIWGKYGWVATYQNKLKSPDIVSINNAFNESIQETGFEQPSKLWGKQIENRDCQITFSALGQNAPFDEKEQYDPSMTKRQPLVDSLRKKLPTFNVRSSGTTSIDVSYKDISKSYGIEQLIHRLHISRDDILYIGDSIFKGGNDYAAIEVGAEYFNVKDSEETKAKIKEIIESFNTVFDKAG